MIYNLGAILYMAHGHEVSVRTILEYGGKGLQVYKRVSVNLPYLRRIIRALH